MLSYVMSFQNIDFCLIGNNRSILKQSVTHKCLKRLPCTTHSVVKMG